MACTTTLAHAHTYTATGRQTSAHTYVHTRIRIHAHIHHRFMTCAEWFPKFGIHEVHAVVLSHDHTDAAYGLDDLRCVCM